MQPDTTGTAAALPEVWPAEATTRGAILASWEKLHAADTPRRYLGMSAIGKECARALWYSFRHAAEEKFEGRMLRLFNRGQREEAVFVEELRRIGCDVSETGEDGQQIAVTALAGHFRGHLDAAAVGLPEAPKTWHVCEFKTHSSKSFAKLTKEGVKKAKPEHYAQMQCYMRYTKMTRALYLAVNKDTDELHAERIDFDPATADALEARAKDIITAALPPPKIADRPDDFRCRFCAAKALCHGTDPTRAVPLSRITCRTCCHATPEMDSEFGRWSCAVTGKTLSDTDQTKVCEKHLLIPDLIHFAAPNDAGTDYIEFKTHDGKCTFIHGQAGKNHFTTKELTILPVEAFLVPKIATEIAPAASPAAAPTQTATLVNQAKSTLGAAFVEDPPALFVLAFSTETDTVWRGPVAKVANRYELRYSEHLAEPLKTASHKGIQIAEFPQNVFVVVHPDGIAEIRESVPF
jgi:hypothetical protein